jgi:hypothetical protein
MSVTFDSAGAGNRLVQTGTTVAASWSHTISTSNADTFVTVVANVDFRYSDTNPVSVSATYGGQTMTAWRGISTAETAGGGANFDRKNFVFHLINPPTGAQTVTVTASATLNIYCIAANSLAYQNVDFFSDHPFYGGDGTSTVSSPVGSRKIILVTQGSAVTPGGWTSRYSSGGTINSTASHIAYGDLLGTGSAAAITPYPGSPGVYSTDQMIPYELFPTGLDGNIRPACKTGSSLQTASAGTATLTHTTEVGNKLGAILVVVHSSGNGTIASPSTVTYGGQNMTLLGNGGTQSSEFLGNTLYYRVSVYGILNISPGTATVSVGTLSPSGNKTLAVMSYANVGSFGTPVGNTGTFSVTGSASGAIVWGGSAPAADAVTHIPRAGGNALNSIILSMPTALIFDTKLPSSSNQISGVGVPIIAAPNGWSSFF